MATRSGSSQVVAAMFVGALFGGLLVALLTPKTGAQLRSDIRSFAGETQQIPEAVEDASGAAKRAFKRSMDEEDQRH